MFSNFQDYVILFHEVVILPHNHTKISQQKILQNDNKNFFARPGFENFAKWLCGCVLQMTHTTGHNTTI